jgi:hypothetical protein
MNPKNRKVNKKQRYAMLANIKHQNQQNAAKKINASLYMSTPLVNHFPLCVQHGL